MGLVRRVLDDLRRDFAPVGTRANDPYSLSALAQDMQFTFNGWSYPISGSQTYNRREETVPQGFEGLISYAYKSNGIVFAVELARLVLFCQARFQFQNMKNGMPGKLFGTQELLPLEQPWPGGTTSDLLAGILQDADFAGNSFTRRVTPRLQRLRPDWMTIVAGSRNDPDVGVWDPGAELLGYFYQPGGRGSGKAPIFFQPEEIAHFAPIPDPVSPLLGMSWLTPVLNEVMGDTAATRHKLKFFENGATVNLAIVMDPNVQLEAFNKWIDMFEKSHRGAENAYKTLYLGGGADPKTIGANLQQADFKVTQGAGETRIAAAGGVPPIIAGLSEGLQFATYSNYGQARRSFGDRMHWLWGNVSGSLERIIPVPTTGGPARLWYDADHIPFLREDSKDQAAVQLVQAQAIRLLVDAGFLADPTVLAVSSGDFSLLLGQHSGLFSVQLQPAGSGVPKPLAPPAPVSGMPPMRGLEDVMAPIEIPAEVAQALKTLGVPVTGVNNGAQDADD